jgi:hypothetical protein
MIVARTGIRLQDRRDERRLARFAAACIVVVALALSPLAGANASVSEHAGSLTQSAADASVGIDRHHAMTGHAGPEHCWSGPSCGFAVALPEAADLGIGKPTPMLARAHLRPDQRTIRPPLHPPPLPVQA